MTNSLLPLNGAKTEITNITTIEAISRQKDIFINIGDSPIAPVMGPPKNLGVLSDSTCSLNDHVNKICQNVNYRLKKLLSLQWHPVLDYCNSLLYGINGYSVSQLQGCQNNAARTVSLRQKYDYITAVLNELHWLPVERRMTDKISSHLLSLLSPCKPEWPLRSQGKHPLPKPRYRLEAFGKRCFTNSTPSLWSTHPVSIKCAESTDTFKSSRKTHLFDVTYS